MRAAARGIVLVMAELALGLGCSHRQPVATLTGSPEALATIESLKGLNDVPASVSATYVFESHQPRRSRWAELCFNGASQASAEAVLKNPSPDYVIIRRVTQKQQGTQYVTAETRIEDGTESYREAPRLYHFPEDPTQCGSMVSLTSIAGQFPFLPTSGKVSTRYETWAGEQCLVIRNEYPALYWETYLSQKDGWLPKRIVFRGISPATRPATLPTTDQTFSLERQVRKWPFLSSTMVVTWTVPAAAFREVDANYGPSDCEIVIDKWVTRPDGRWFITEATTSSPLFRRSIHYRVENLSFAPIAASVFEKSK